MQVRILDNVDDGNGGRRVVEYVKEIDFQNSEGRHDDLCIVCGITPYPECREWCPIRGYEDKS